MQATVAQQLTTAAGAFLWRSHLERLAWQELHRPLRQGGLGISCVSSRAQALWAKQACWALAAGGNAAAHVALWAGHRLEDLLPDLEFGERIRPPRIWDEAAQVLREAIQLEGVGADGLAAAAAKRIYIAFTDTLPPPKVEAKWPAIQWTDVWRRLDSARASKEEVDTTFHLLHNILPLKGRLRRFGLAAAADCTYCPGEEETVDHVFVACGRAAPVWERLLLRLLAHVPAVPSDAELLRLAWPPADRDADVTATVIAYHSFIWDARHQARPPEFAEFEALLTNRRPPFIKLW